MAQLENIATLDEQDKRLTAMAGLLDEEGRLYGRLLDLARQKQRALVDGRLGDLEAVLEEEQRVLHTVAGLEEERYALQCDLAKQFGCAPGEMTVSRLAEAAGGPHGARLRERQQALVALIHDLSAVNQCNTELIQQSLAYVNFAIDTLAGGAAPTYGEAGQRRRSQALRLFNKRA